MGSTINTGACNLYMEFVSNGLTLYPLEIKPTQWYRYVDDVVEVVK